MQLYISITNVLVRVEGPRTRFPGLGALLHLASKTPPLPCFGHLDARKHRTCHALATRALEGAARGPARCTRGARMGRSSPHLVPPRHSKGCTTPRSMPPGHSKGLLEPPLSAPRALSGAAQACSVPQAAPSGCSSLFSVPPVRSERHFDHLLGAAEGRSSYLLCHLTLDEAFGNAAQRICPRLHLRSVTLRSAALCSVHGYARVHTSIYIYIYIFEGGCQLHLLNK